MGRLIKEGLDYFPKDADFYRDRKIRALIGRFGADGAILYDYILCEVYGDKGYYTAVDDEFADIAAADLGMSPEKIGLILDYLLNKSMLLDGTLFKTVKVLTSHGIQTRYQEAVRRRAQNRGVEVSGKLWLLNEAETESFIKVRHDENKLAINEDKCAINEDKCANNFQSKGKESKGKERKVKGVAPPLRGSAALNEAFEKWLAYKREKGQSYKPIGLQSLTNQVQQAAEKYGELAVFELIDDAIASNYAGLHFDRLSRNPVRKEISRKEDSIDIGKLKKLVNQI